MQILIETGSFESGEPAIVLSDNQEIWNDKKQPCPHCHSPFKVVHTRSDLSTWEGIYWKNPFTALIPYDGDCCQTEICVKCLLDGIEESGVNTKNINKHEINEFSDIPTLTEINSYLLKSKGWELNVNLFWENGSDLLSYEPNSEGQTWLLNGIPIQYMEEISDRKQ